MLKKLSPEEAKVILSKGTEPPYSGKYNQFNAKGDYSCKQCGSLLYHSKDKFNSGCGWPSFDDEIPGAIRRLPDSDGHRTEIVCAHCGGHLGHIFLNEGYTPKNIRHCVNSLSLDFIPEKESHPSPSETAIFAGGCFWGIEHSMKQLPGVLSVVSGYTGGSKVNPTYEEVCYQETGHAEAVKISFDPNKITYEALVRHFFEIHDPTQLNQQGQDKGKQYRSEIFYTSPEQKETTLKVIHDLKHQGIPVVTRVSPASQFWKAEEYHQDYYAKNKKY